MASKKAPYEAKTYGFLVYVTALNEIDHVDVHNILQEAFKADLWSDISEFKVGPLGAVSVSKAEMHPDNNIGMTADEDDD